jgi:hypothetical protein
VRAHTGTVRGESRWRWWASAGQEKQEKTMFTVLHRGPDGSETYYECQTVTRFAEEGQQTVPPLGKVALSGVRLDNLPGNDITLAIEGPFGAVFVMNNEGATIAKYVLSGKVAGSAEAQ